MVQARKMQHHWATPQPSLCPSTGIPYFLLFPLLVQTSFMSTWHKLDSSGEAKWDHAPTKLACRQVWGTFSWQMIESPGHCGWRLPGAGGPGCQKKAGWTRREEQARKQQSFVASASVPVLRFLRYGVWPESCKVKWSLSPLMLLVTAREPSLGHLFFLNDFSRF